MALRIQDGASATQYLPNSGIDACYSASSLGTVTTTFTSATDVFQMVGAAGVIARIRRIEIFSNAMIAAASITLAASATLVRLMRRTAAGTTGSWTALTEAAGQVGRFGGRLGTDAAASVVVNVAGTTAFTVGAGTQLLRQGWVGHPVLLTVTNTNGHTSGIMNTTDGNIFVLELPG